MLNYAIAILIFLKLNNIHNKNGKINTIAVYFNPTANPKIKPEIKSQNKFLKEEGLNILIINIKNAIKTIELICISVQSAPTVCINIGEKSVSIIKHTVDKVFSKVLFKNRLSANK